MKRKQPANGFTNSLGRPDGWKQVVNAGIEAIVMGQRLPMTPAQLDMASRMALGPPHNVMFIARQAAHHAEKVYEKKNPVYYPESSPESIARRLHDAMPLVFFLQPRFEQTVASQIRSTYNALGWAELLSLHQEFMPGGPGYERSRARFHSHFSSKKTKT
jgi:hypothetical protein